MKRIFNRCLFFVLSIFFYSACSEDSVPMLQAPTVENIELGLGDNGIGVIGQDFHFNADVVAGNKIETVEITIRQKGGETYPADWSMSILWDQYKGLKNTNIHKHFDIPEDAVEGIYDFVVLVKDQNGETTEILRDLSIYPEGSLPVNPQLILWNVQKNNSQFYGDGEFAHIGESFSKGDTLYSQVGVSGIKGEGVVYLLLIHEQANHHPETIEEVDFDKVTVYDMHRHSGMEDVDTFSNFEFDVETFTVVRNLPSLEIGAPKDNSSPTPSQVTWSSGNYKFLMLYKNETYSIYLKEEISIAVEL